MICARGGSKGLPGKNLKLLGGKPLIAWSIEAAKKSTLLDRILLSTDDLDILQVAREYGCEAPFVRPPELATDTADIVDVIIHALDQAGSHYDYVVLLQATSPFRIAVDIDAAIKLCQSAKADSCVSVTTPSKSPYWMYTLGADDRMHQLIAQNDVSRRQDLPAAWVLNGAVYVVETKWFRQARKFVGPNTIAYKMPVERSVDIDIALDFRVAEMHLGSLNLNISEELGK